MLSDGRPDSLVSPTETRTLDLGGNSPTLPAAEGPQPEWIKRRIHRWKSPLLMVVFYIIGLAMSLAHCIFYPKLKGVIVGNPDSQEGKIRQVPRAFAFLSQICLSTSVWISYTQWLWRTVNKTEMTVGGLNAAFGADTSVLSLLNLEMLQELRVGSAMALFAWGLLLPPFFTPATLFVYPSTKISEVEQLMPYPAIADSSAGHRFAYSPPILRGTTQHFDDVSRKYTGPRTIVSLISTATASLGEILSVSSFYNSSTYSVDFFAPIVRCREADPSEATQIDGFLKKEMAIQLGTNNETDSAYYSFVPTWSASGELTAVSQPRLQTPSNATNQLWMTFLRFKQRHYQVCQLHNATYHLNITRDHGYQNISGSYDVHEKVAYPNDKPGDISNMAEHAYTAFMWVLSDQLVGKFSWYENSSSNQSTTSPANLSTASQFGLIDSPISRTSLLGSVDLDAFFEFDEERGLYATKNETLGDQRLQDKAFARNRTLDVLIEELSFNMTVSLMHNDLLTHKTLTTVLVRTPVNCYAYKTYGLFIPYALANLFTFLVVAMGLYSYIHDGVRPDKKFQDIVVAAEDPEFVQVVRSRKRSVTAVMVGERIIWRAGTMDLGRGLGRGQVRKVFWWRGGEGKRKRKRRERVRGRSGG
ncbi:uncharacterized protein BDR25DRAFT_223485 [Lindgomyces ingoldianus]|uniref:Uncharacterized protein n=1 Tax=Lindgomyces ingoldianus TaxID=673940 RepID=A0ACB6QYH9_9PLEO|nr:uncharacterized protein BDR25DRAFT_223485 [Lindgomyces ingoldianus]KAF2471142.1 hypothetical protein BDR25DRAFT_223485 [Lindgomyces ingoldianus]